MTSSQPSKDGGFPEIDFRECPRCHGYGVLDSGVNCRNCGGNGRGGLLNPDATIGSGEVMYDKKTGRRITHKEFYELVKTRRAPPKAEASGIRTEDSL
jgi:hypothetical protein